MAGGRFVEFREAVSALVAAAAGARSALFLHGSRLAALEDRVAKLDGGADSKKALQAARDRLDDATMEARGVLPSDDFVAALDRGEHP